MVPARNPRQVAGKGERQLRKQAAHSVPPFPVSRRSARAALFLKVTVPRSSAPTLLMIALRRIFVVLFRRTDWNTASMCIWRQRPARRGEGKGVRDGRVGGHRQLLHSQADDLHPAGDVYFHARADGHETLLRSGLRAAGIVRNDIQIWVTSNLAISRIRNPARSKELSTARALAPLGSSSRLSNPDGSQPCPPEAAGGVSAEKLAQGFGKTWTIDKPA